MAIMLPSRISPDVKSNAEKKIFKLFQDAPNTEDWHVLHSLGISNHKTQIYGEIDFLVLAPNLGLFSLEVKGGRVSRKNGIWNFTNRYGETSSSSKGPFEQARDGIYSVIGNLKSKPSIKVSDISTILHGSGVLFPDIEFDYEGIEAERYEIFDVRNGNNIKRYIEELAFGIKRKLDSTYGSKLNIRHPTRSDIRHITNLLRGDFDRVPPLSIELDEIDNELIALTEEQYKCLDQLEDNNRCIIQGPAGTGKTLLAIEAAKKAVAKGYKVALFCYNRNLGLYLEKYFQKQSENIRPAYVGTLHKFLVRFLNQNNVSISEDSNNPNYFDEILPATFLEYVIKHNIDFFDYLIIDEAQDLITERYLDVFDLCLLRGFNRGRWTMFGDFSMQAIFSNNLVWEDMRTILEKRTGFGCFRLTVNCRNTSPIQNAVCQVAQLPKGIYAQSSVKGLPVDYLTYTTDREQQKKLEHLLIDLIKEKISKKDITLLSPKQKENSIVSLVKNFTVVDLKELQEFEITFSTIHSFKGLENKVIILTDITNLSDKKLLYVALSRARVRLYVLLTQNALSEYNEILIENIQK